MVLIHSGKRILPEVSEKLSAYALRKLRSRGIEVQLETRVKSCSPGIIRLSDGKTIRAILGDKEIAKIPDDTNLVLVVCKEGALTITADGTKIYSSAIAK
jgi:pyruvate/2-oxoglutarate dehydrogenase complex dihydrolipoamide dehydrogenase (E3) component